MALETPTPQRTLQRYGFETPAKLTVNLTGIRFPCEPWALAPEDRPLCRQHGRSLLHKVRIQAGGQVRIVRLRDSTLAISDGLLERLGGVQVAPLPSRRGIFTHKVRTDAGWKSVWENTKTGEFTTGGRARQGPFWLTWHPTPAILTILRAKGLAQLLQQPVVPVKLTAKTPRALQESDKVPRPRRNGAPVNSAQARHYHVARIEFLNPIGGA